MTALQAARVTVDDDPVAVSDAFYERGWTDGLPIIPPTPERVEAMLAGWRAEPGRSIGAMPPAFAETTLEKIAINAVMAGCKPEQLPAVVAALETMLDPAFNLNGIQCTTSATAPLVIFHGPIRHTAGINCAAGALGPGFRGNATVGRAIRLVLLNVGGAIPGSVDKAALGQPGKFAFCFGENEERSPWPPFHADRGLEAGESAVTVVGVTGSIEVRDSFSKTGHGILTMMAHSITPAAFVAGNNDGHGGEAVVVFTPEHAAQIHSAGHSRATAQAALWEAARLPLEHLPDETARLAAAWQRQVGASADGFCRVAREPGGILILVAGGEGSKSAFLPTWGGITRSITRPIAETAASLHGG